MNNPDHLLPEPSELIRQYGPLVWKTAAAYLDNPDDIQECVNDTFSEFYLYSSRYDPQKGSYAAFLSAAARNKAIDLYRKNRSASSALLPSDSRQPAGCAAAARSGIRLEEIPDPEDMAEKAALRLDLEKAISSLKPEESELIRMKYFDSMTIKEIADSLELPYETVKKRHQRALHKLRNRQTFR